LAPLAIQGLMGHASLATTQGYLDLVARDRQAAAAAHPALRRLRAATSKAVFALSSKGGRRERLELLVQGREADLAAAWCRAPRRTGRAGRPGGSSMPWRRSTGRPVL